MDGRRGNSLKLCQGRCRLTVVSNFFMERFVQPWHRACGGMGQQFGLAVLGQWLDSVVSKGFSNPNKSMVL